MTGIELLEGQAELPTPQSTASYWHHQPAEALMGHRTTAELPAEADVVVIGSGITGAFAARELVAGGRSVLMLEAREACWGATGRNGGHCQPLVYAAKPHIARFELDTYEFLRRLVEERGVQCDFRTVGGVHALPSDETVNLVKRHLAQLKVHHPELAKEAFLVTDPKELARLQLPKSVVGAVYQPKAAKCWPYKLVTWVLKDMLLKKPAEAFNLQTNTPVLHLQRSGDTGSSDDGSSSPWVLSTARGRVAARHVVLATNAYTSHLLPKLTGLLVPVRGQVSALRPPSEAWPLAHSHVWQTPKGGDDYLVQRPTGELILGGERQRARGAEVGVSRDDEVNPDVARRLRRALRGNVKFGGRGVVADAADGEDDEDDDDDEDESEDDSVEAERGGKLKLPAEYEWTGIMGYSRDGSPWVGRVPEQLGGDDGGSLWISAGYTGHGMASAARCGIAVAEELLGRPQATVDLPHEFHISAARADAARSLVLPSTMEEELRALFD